MHEYINEICLYIRRNIDQDCMNIQAIAVSLAGIDFVTSPGLATSRVYMTNNARGQFSSTLAEYTLMACSYYAKDIPRLMSQKRLSYGANTMFWN